MTDFATQAIRGQMETTPYREHSTPLFLTSSFTFPDAERMQEAFAGETDALIYSRYNNPNTDELIRKMCALEGTEAGFATASGMSAVFASLMAFLRAGDHVLATRSVFGSTHQLLTQLLPRYGITHTYIDPIDQTNWEVAVQPNTQLLLIETPSNPGLQVVDLEAAGRFARTHELLFVADNCFATPYLQRPADFGADIVLHSATKWLDGQGRVLGGLVLGSTDRMEEVTFFCRHTGPALSPFHAWMLSKSLETLAVRMDAHCRSALALAHWLEGQAGVASVLYPFLESHPQHAIAKQQMRLGGGIVSFELKGGKTAALQLINQAQLCTRSSNLGDTRSILTHPATTTHSKLSAAERASVGITDSLVRISVGLEALADIQADLVNGLQ